METSTPQSMNIKLMIGIGIVALVIIVAVLMVISSRQDNAVTTDSPPVPANASDPENHGHSH